MRSAEKQGAKIIFCTELNKNPEAGTHAESGKKLSHPIGFIKKHPIAGSKNPKKIISFLGSKNLRKYNPFFIFFEFLDIVIDKPNGSHPDRGHY